MTALWALVTLTVALCGAFAIGIRERRRWTAEQHALRLRGQAAPLLERRLTQLAELDINELAPILVEDLSSAGVAAAVFGDDGTVIASAGDANGVVPAIVDQTTIAAALGGERERCWLRRNQDRIELTVLAVPEAWGEDRHAVIALTTDISRELHGADQLARVMSVGLVAILAAGEVISVTAGGAWPLLTLLALPALYFAARTTRPADLPAVLPEAAEAPRPTAERTRLAASIAQMEQAFLNQQVSEERMRKFVADVSHELRTPLTSMSNATGILRRVKSDPERVVRVAEVVGDQAERMARLVDDLLVLTKLEVGTGLEREVVDLCALAQAHINELRLAFPQRQVRLVCEGTLEVEADRAAIERVLRNLTSNAARHTALAGKIELTIARRHDEAVIEVRDDGEGIAKDELPRIFERFVRLNGEGVASGGSGLGLAIVRETAQAHDGAVEVESELGRGTTFRIRLPANA